VVEPVAPAPATFSHWALRQIPNVSGRWWRSIPIPAACWRSTRLVVRQYQFDRRPRPIARSARPSSVRLLAALDNGMTPSTLILNDPIELEQGPPADVRRAIRRPGELPGPHPLRVAIEKSLNIMTVRMATTSARQDRALYRALGLMDKMRCSTPRCWVPERPRAQTRQRLCHARQCGKRITPSLIDRVEDRDGKVVFKHDMRACPRCATMAGAPMRGAEPAGRTEQVLTRRPPIRWSISCKA